MPLPFSHPTAETLRQLAIGDLSTLSATEQQRLRAHVAACSRCQRDVMLLHASRGDANSAAPKAPTSVLERVLSDRRQGARVILPTQDAMARRSLGRPVGAIAAALLLVAFIVRAVSHTPEATAGDVHGELRFDPATPPRGHSVAVHYRASQQLAAAPRLVLRAVLRTQNTDSYDGGIPVSTVVTLQRRGDQFTGSFVLPDSVWYGAFVVEDTAGAVIDDNGGHFWDLLVAAADGRPAFRAVSQHIAHLMGRNWEEGFATARQLTELYPDSLGAWSELSSFQGWLGLDKTDSVRAQRRAVLERFMTPGASPDLGALYWYALSVDTAVASRLRARLLREQPKNPLAVQERLMDILRRTYKTHDTTAALRDLDQLWAETRDIHRRGQVANYTFGMLVLPSKRADAIRAWGGRTVESEAGVRSSRPAAQRLAEQFARIPELRPEALTSLRAELAAVDRAPDTERKLGETRSAMLERNQATRRGLYAALGRALVADGQRAAGLDTLALAAAAGWDVQLFREIANTRLAAGDSAGANELFARVIVDPGTSDAAGDSLLPRMRAIGHGNVDSLRSAARSALIVRVLAESRTRSLRPVHVLDSAGTAHALAELARGRITVVGFWSRNCGPAITDLPSMNAVASKLSADGIAVVSIVEEPPSADLDTWLRDQHVTMPVYHDERGEASHAFNPWGTPYYYVVDGEGRLRFGPYNEANQVLLWAERSDGRPRRRR